MLLYIHLLLHPHRTISCSSSPSPPHPSSNHQSAECSTRSAAACPPVLRPSARSGHGAGGLWWLGTLHHCPSSPSSLPRVCITIRSVIQNSNIFESCPVFDCKQIIKHIQKIIMPTPHGTKWLHSNGLWIVCEMLCSFLTVTIWVNHWKCGHLGMWPKMWPKNPAVDVPWPIHFLHNPTLRAACSSCVKITPWRFFGKRRRMSCLDWARRNERHNVVLVLSCVYVWHILWYKA